MFTYIDRFLRSSLAGTYLLLTCAIFQLGSCFDSKSSDETHFSRIKDIRSTDLNDVKTLFIADIEKVQRIIADVESKTITDQLLFKYSRAGSVAPVAYLDDDRNLIRDIPPPQVLNYVGGYLVLGYLDPDRPTDAARYETIIVRQSDGSVAYLGSGLDFFPLQSSAQTKNIYLDQDGSVYFLSGGLTHEYVTKITDLRSKTFSPNVSHVSIGSSDHDVSQFAVGPDGLVVYTGVELDPNGVVRPLSSQRYYLNGRAMEAGATPVLSGSRFAGAVFANRSGVYSMVRDRWTVNTSTGWPSLIDVSSDDVSFLGYSFSQQRDDVTASIAAVAKLSDSSSAVFGTDVFPPVVPSSLQSSELSATQFTGQFTKQFDFQDADQQHLSTVLLYQPAEFGAAAQFWLLSHVSKLPGPIAIQFVDDENIVSPSRPFRVTSFVPTKVSIVCAIRDLTTDQEAIITVKADGTGREIIALGSFSNIKIELDGKANVVFEGQQRASEITVGTIDLNDGSLYITGQKPFDVAARSIILLD